MTGTNKIETNRLVLRRFRMEDANSYFQNVTSDPKVYDFFALSCHEKLSQTEEMIENRVASYESPYTYLWAITVKESGEVIGEVSIDSSLMSFLQTGEIAYMIGSRWWGLGYATECVSAVITYLFEDGVYLIEGKHSNKNMASGNVLRKAGMTKEAVLKHRRIDKVTGERTDLIIYSIINPKMK